MKRLALVIALALSLSPHDTKAEQVRSETNRFDGSQKVSYVARAGECIKLKGDNKLTSCTLVVVHLGEEGAKGFYVYFPTTNKQWNLLHFKNHSKIHWIGTLSDGTTIKGYGEDIVTRVTDKGVIEIPWLMVTEGDPVWEKLKDLKKIEIGIAGEEYEWTLNKEDLSKTFSLLK